MDITKAIWFEIVFQWRRSIEKMSNKRRKLMFNGGRGQTMIVCRFCQKSLVKKEANMHMYGFNKVPQEMLNLSLQNTLGW